MSRGVSLYQLYGLSLKSLLPLQAPKKFSGEAVVADGGEVPIDPIELIRGTRRFFSEIRRNLNSAKNSFRFHYHSLPDSADYARYFDLAEFWIAPDGKEIIYQNPRNGNHDSHQMKNGCSDSFLNYLQVNALSFVLIKRGIEPLHATALAREGKAFGLLGDPGYGKSTLAASFLASGFLLLTDDLLVLRKKGLSFYASPGVPQIKLFPKIAKRFLGNLVDGPPMNPESKKLIIPLNGNHTERQSVPLKALYVIHRPKQIKKQNKVEIQKIHGRQASLEILNASYNSAVQNPERLHRQLLFATELAKTVPLRFLSYPRDLRQLPEVRNAILEDLNHL